MCGRFTYKFNWKQLHRLLGLTVPDSPQPLDLRPRFNVAPTDNAPIGRLTLQGDREAVMARWGLVPSWAKDLAIGNKAINARVEGIADKPMFRAAIRARRCLVPVSGFYEWTRVPGQKIKQPWYIYAADGEPMCFAGLWERWTGERGPLDTFTIITTQANAFMQRFHERMPAVLQPEDYAGWLDPATPQDRVLALPTPAADGFLDAHPVSTRVNRPGPDDAALTERIARTTLF